MYEMIKDDIESNSTVGARRKDLQNCSDGAEDILNYQLITGCDYLIKSKTVEETYKVVLYWKDGSITYSVDGEDLENLVNRAKYINENLRLYPGVFCARVRKIRITKEEV